MVYETRLQVLGFNDAQLLKDIKIIRIALRELEREIYTFDKAVGCAYAATPDYATVRNTFYNLDDHPQRFSLEPLLGINEDKVAPPIADLLRHKDIRQLNADDRYKLAVLVAVQRARTFGEQVRISAMISVLVNKMVAIGATEELAGETLGLTPGGEHRDIFLRQLVQQVLHIDHLLSKDWYLLETKPEHPFFMSDNPVVMENRNDLGPYGISVGPARHTNLSAPVIDADAGHVLPVHPGKNGSR